MYVPAWPTLNPASFLKAEHGGTLPYPLSVPTNMYFYVARNGIYHLMRSLGITWDDSILAPDYHHGNEINAIRAAGAKILYYPITKSFRADLDAVEKLC